MLSNLKRQAVAASALLLSTGVVLADSYIPTGVSADFTQMQSDFTALLGYAVPVILLSYFTFPVIKLIRRMASKV